MVVYYKMLNYRWRPKEDLFLWRQLWTVEAEDVKFSMGIDRKGSWEFWKKLLWLWVGLGLGGEWGFTVTDDAAERTCEVVSATFSV